MSSVRQPTLFIPHGAGPCFFMEWTMGRRDTWDAMGAWLSAIDASLPSRPMALLVVSAHWEAPEPTLNVQAEPPLLYDYSGFPPHTYELTWPAPGAPQLGERASRLLADAGFAVAEETSRGLDHGVFIPMKLAYPEATIPTLQLSLVRGLDPAAHLAMGRALAQLRDEGVLIIGSGMSFHRMRPEDKQAARDGSRAFDAWLRETASAESGERERRLLAWEDAPSGRYCHPREEHLLPLMVCAGAALDDPGEVAFEGDVHGVKVSALRFG